MYRFRIGCSERVPTWIFPGAYGLWFRRKILALASFFRLQQVVLLDDAKTQYGILFDQFFTIGSDTLFGIAVVFILALLVV